ncbi:MAG: type II toxin-antitoxin system VapC family toxin [Nitrosotalea sp.]
MKVDNNIEYLIDTSCWMEYHNNTDIGKKIKKIIKDGKRYTPTAVIGELRNNIRNDKFFAIKATVLTESETIHCDDNISEFAGQLRKDKPGGTRISWVDYIIVATAKVRGLTVCSTDHHFDHFKGIIDVKIFEK